MKRRTKALSLALTAFFAVSAITASAAFAAAPEVHVEVATATLKGDAPIGATHFFQFKNQKGSVLRAECLENSFAGSLAVKTVTDFTLVPTYSKCELAGIAATVKANECFYTFTMVAGSNPPTANVDLNCPTGKEITIENAFCTIHIGGQASPPENQNLSHAVFTNNGAGVERDITISVTLTNISYEITAGCPKQTANEARSDGEYKEEITLTAFTGGVRQGIWVQ